MPLFGILIRTALGFCEFNLIIPQHGVCNSRRNYRGVVAVQSLHAPALSQRRRSQAAAAALPPHRFPLHSKESRQRLETVSPALLAQPRHEASPRLQHWKSVPADCFWWVPSPSPLDHESAYPQSPSYSTACLLHPPHEPERLPTRCCNIQHDRGLLDTENSSRRRHCPLQKLHLHCGNHCTACQSLPDLSHQISPVRF
jgi:hypothetical protein